MYNKKMEKQLLAVAILTLNEEKDLPGCIQSVKSLNCPIFVVDSMSNDQTNRIARDLNVEIIEFRWNRKYPKKKQWTLDYLKNRFEWILLLDADERLNPSLSQEVMNVLKPSQELEKIDVVAAKLDYYFEGRLLKYGFRPTKHILLRADSVQFPEIEDLEVTNMWEVEGHYQTNGGKRIAKFNNRLIHFDTGGMYQLIARHNRYSDWEAFVNNNPEVKKKILATKGSLARIMELLPFKGLFIFFHSYILKLGFLDGRRGFDFAVHRLFYFWQIKSKEYYFEK